MSENLVVLKTQQEVVDLIEYVKAQEFLSFDTETTGIDKDAKIIGISVSAEVDLAFYVILAYWDVETQKIIDLETQDNIKDLLLVLKDKQLVAHNAVFDCQMINSNYGIELIQSIHTDTMVLAHLLDENRRNGLKELGSSLFGDEAKDEQKIMKASVVKNGGVLTRDKYELYKADADLIGRYGAKDTILTLKLFYALVPKLYEESLDKFFYEDESMPLLRETTYKLNTIGLRIDAEKLQNLKGTLEAECLELKAFVYKEIDKHIKDKYPGTKPKTTFNIGASQQMSWLLYSKLGNEFDTLTDAGKEICKALGLKIPYAPGAKRQFIQTVIDNKDQVYQEAQWNPKTKKMGRPKKVGDPWKYITCNKVSMAKLSNKYKFVDSLLKYYKNLKLLNTYVIGTQERMRYNIIQPSFLQIGTTSGRYSSKNPNYMNLPRDDKRIKECIVARPGKVLIGADYAQLEPRVFASVSKDKNLMECFAKGEDFYSVIGVSIFDKRDLSVIKSDENSFAKKFPKLRDQAKVVALAKPYGRTDNFTAIQMGITKEEAADIGDKYFQEHPSVELMMLESHEQAKKNGKVYTEFGRPRRIPDAMEINKIYGNSLHSELPYSARTLLNLAMNHRVQGTAASIINRASINFYERTNTLGIEATILLQIHDELVAECYEKDKEIVAVQLKLAMETTVKLNGVDLVAEPKIGYSLAELK